MRALPPPFPQLPRRLGRLPELAYNLWWSWNPAGRELFRRIDLERWSRSRHNPVRLLRGLEHDTLLARSRDPDFLREYEKVLALFEAATRPRGTAKIAYLCAEFGLDPSLPIYSGGLGLLAGDICKEASDLEIPLVAVGALYREGYFCQRLEGGEQREEYLCLETSLAPLLEVSEARGRPLRVVVPLAGRQIRLRIWKVAVGRVALYLLDTDTPENREEDRLIFRRLYAQERRRRLEQEILLGIGSVRALQALGYQPERFHLNEGHVSFALLERLRHHLARGASREDAFRQVARESLFTTHTPVKAGHDTFPFPLVEECLGEYCRELGFSQQELLKLGQEGKDPLFNMTVLALRHAGRSTAVSRRHGEVSRRMWRKLWPQEGRPPIAHVTNGVHLPTWLATPWLELLDAHLEKEWRERQDQPEVWRRLAQIPGATLWQTHRRLKRKLLDFLAGRAESCRLEPETLTLGFARRFATYKRATLILQDRERLLGILRHPERPVQIIFAGKAHPADEPGKALVREVVRAAQWSDGRIVFVEDYDSEVARHLVQGVDLWLNNPRPPLEASGTSGQKAALNGVPSLSVLDGWWCEGFNGKNGWAIQEEEGEEDSEVAARIYQVLESRVTPLFYERAADGVPHGWVEMMREAMASVGPRFCARRMMKEYLEHLYGSAP